MSEMPKKIWVDCDWKKLFDSLKEQTSDDDIAYIRADLVDEAVRALRAAAETFDRYASHHGAKGDSVKAGFNSELARIMEDALEKLEES